MKQYCKKRLFLIGGCEFIEYYFAEYGAEIKI